MALGINSMRQNTVMAHNFSKVPTVQMERSSFRRSSGHKTAFNSGYLVPIYADEALPGDTFKMNMSSVARLQAMVQPVMDNLYMDFFFFAVPNRLVWNNFQKFMGEQTDPDDSTDFSVPQIELGAGTVGVGGLADYFGIPINIAGLNFNSLHFRAYNLIYNEWFRDQNLQDSVVVDKDDGPDDLADYVLLKRGKRHDYFTSCLPWPQKGDAVDLPLGISAPVLGNGKTIGLISTFPSSAAAHRAGLVNASGGNDTRAYGDLYNTNVGTALSGATWAANTSVGLTDEGAKSGLIADLSGATAATINELREAFQMQKLLERDARGGTRYTEIIRSHFSVVSPDARLQRPEYLGGGSSRIIIDPVPVTSKGTGSTRNIGELGAAVYHHQSGIGFTKSFVEHSVIIGLACVRADLTYQTGLDRMWSRQSKYDFYWPALAHIGEQAVLNKEIYAQGTAGGVADEGVFGYQERWAEYRYKPSLITGVLRSNAASTLDVWHLSQDFSALPVLNDAFIAEDPPIARVVTVTNQPQIIFDSFFDLVTTRPMPTYSVPGLIDHF